MRALILGAGEAGRFLAASLSQEAEVVLVDNDAARLAEAEESLDVLLVQGDVTHRRVLERAEAHRADVAVAVTGSDAVNVAAAVMAKAAGVGRTIARVDDPGFYHGQEGLERDVAGIDACICASRLVGRELLRLVGSVDVGFSTSLGGGTAHVALVGIDEASPLRGEGPGKLRSRNEAVVRAVLRGGTLRGTHEVETLEEGDRMLVVGSPLAVTALVQRSRTSGRGRVGLVGGGDVGLQLANLFATLVDDVRLIERGRGRCEDLAQLAPAVTVLHGDGTNLSFLREERLGSADWVLAVTGSDEVNLMSSLLAHELGVTHTFALVHRPGYTAVYEHLGISGTTSAHEVMARTLQGLLPGRVLVNASTLSGTDLELLELRVPALRRPLSPRSLPLGPGAQVVAVVDHDEVTRLHDATTEVRGGEHVVAVAPMHRRREILRALQKLEGVGVNPRVVSGLTGLLIGIIALFLLIPTGMAIYDEEPRAVFAYGSATGIALALAFVLRWLGGGTPQEIHRKDALGVVALTWLLLGVVGGLPMVLEGSIPDPMGAIFETVSGFTTSGGTVVADVDGLSRATNLWRCLTHWVGGMGIVVLFIAVFPILGVGAKHLFKSEVPGPITEGLRPKIKQTAVALWWVYTGLTALCVVLLMIAGMSLFDAVCHAMATLGTGGFSTRTASVGYYQSAAIDWIITAFMLIGGLNFGLYYGALRGRWSELWTNYELRFYLGVNAAVIAVVAVCILDRHSPLDAVRFAAFQTASVSSTTGFMTEDFDQYPELARFSLFVIMFMGACAGSTAGGLKASRVFILLKVVVRELRAAVRPNVVQTIRVGGVNLPPDVVRGIGTFFAAYMLLFAASSFVLVALGLDIVSSMGGTIACLSNVGPGLNELGPAMNYGPVPTLGKAVLCLCMIAGRLEIFALFAVFTPECWRR